MKEKLFYAEQYNQLIKGDKKIVALNFLNFLKQCTMYDNTFFETAEQLKIKKTTLLSSQVHFKHLKGLDLREGMYKTKIETSYFLFSPTSEKAKYLHKQQLAKTISTELLDSCS